MRPLFTGIPLILLIVAGFVAGMNFVPASSPYFTWVIIGYVVLFPAVLAWTIVGTIRNVRRLIAGGDAILQSTGRRTKAQVKAVRRRSFTVRTAGSPRLTLYDVTLRVDGPGSIGYDARVTKAVPMWGEPPAVGDTVDVNVDTRDRDNLFVHWPDTRVAPEVAGGLEAVPLQLRALLQKTLDMAGASGDTGGHPPEPPAPPRDEQPPSPQLSPTPMAGAIEGRARVEALMPWPDGTYDLDLYVTPKGRASYKVAVRTAVPHGRVGDIKRGVTLPVRVDPTFASHVEIDWARTS